MTTLTTTSFEPAFPRADGAGEIVGQAETVMQANQVEQTENVQQADALLWLSAWPDESADAILTDPPYNIGYGYDGAGIPGWSDALPDEDYYAEQLFVCTEAARVLRPGGRCCTCITRSLPPGCLSRSPKRRASCR